MMWRCRGVVTSRRSLMIASARSGISSLFTSRRCLSMPDPSELFTSPSGLMALLYGRTGAPPTSLNGPAEGGRSRRWQRQRRNSNAGEKASSEAEQPTSFWANLVRRDAVILALAVFLLSALWDVFSSQKGIVWQKIKNFFVVTLEVRSSQADYAMIIDWMGRQPHGQCTRSITLKPVSVQDEAERNRNGYGSASEDVSAESDVETVTFVPGYGSHFFRFEGTWLWIQRSEDPTKKNTSSFHRVDREDEKITISFLSRRRAVAERFIAAVRSSWEETNLRNSVRIYIGDVYGGNWRLLTERLRRPLSTLYLPTETKAIVEEVSHFLHMKSTYGVLGIPWRRGYLLEGPPGTGKSSFVMALAGQLGLPVHILSLRSQGLDDDSLLSLMSSLPKRAILLIEDFENALKSSSSSASDTRTTPVDQKDPALNFSTEIGGDGKSAVSLSALLNALDGIASSEGRVLLITTNDPDKIPFSDALLRPGRIDKRVSFKPLDAEQTLKMKMAFADALRASSHAGLSDLGPGAPLLADESAAQTPAAYQQELLNLIYEARLSTVKRDDN